MKNHDISKNVEISIKIRENEEKIQRELILNSGKPSNIVDKILDGKMKKFYSEVTLLNQSYNQRTALIQKELESELLKFENMKKIHRKFRRSRNKSNREAAKRAKEYIDENC